MKSNGCVSSTKVTSLERKPGQCIWRSWLPIQDAPLGLADVVQRKAEQYIWLQLGCRNCRKEAYKVPSNCLWDSTLDLYGVYSLAFSSPKAVPQDSGGLGSDLLDGLPSQVDELNLPLTSLYSTCRKHLLDCWIHHWSCLLNPPEPVFACRRSP
ncbi:Hypothetical predicted protein [Podarcis lilfordi]|uniref:Uncharacterized protein n=1 Tax=Podarcis lilfordi TaxID=74358 RepID=A0AA35LK59_9SAUR|nr:Hypothetical predicted protein [Podarcis lilfordi]